MGSQRCQLGWTLAFVALLGGCAGNSDRFPSLAIREAERFSGTFNPPPSDPAEAVPAVTDTQTLAQLVDKARSAHARFIETEPGTAALVEQARGLTAETNEWASAQIALADLAAHRSEALIALGDIDLLAAQAATTFAPEADIAAAQEQVSSWITIQDNVLLTLMRESEE